MLDAFGIINMGGRIYDAELGKMLQADPIVQNPNTSQSFNRYAYVHNNPLSFTDPTGYFTSLRQVLAAVAFVVISIFAAPLGVFLAGFLAGFASTLILTGNLKTALKAGLITGAIAFVGAQFAGTDALEAANSGSKAAAGGTRDTVTQTAMADAAPVALSASGTASIWSKLNAFDIVSQVVASLNPEAGTTLAFLRGGRINLSSLKGIGGTLQNLASFYGKLKASQELERFARKNGMSLAELNLALVALSFAGNKLVGTRFFKDGYTNNEPGQGLRGMFSRKGGTGLIDFLDYPTLNRTIGIIFDVVDIGLGFQGLITASGYDAIRNGDETKTIGGLSLGSMDANNLVARGYFPNGVAKSLVFGNIGHSNVIVILGPLDIINGFIFGKILSPFAIFAKQPKNTFGFGCMAHELSGCY